MTLILKNSEIKKYISIDKTIIPIIERAFIALSNKKAIMPPIMRLDIEENNGEVDVKTAYIKGLDNLKATKNRDINFSHFKTYSEKVPEYISVSRQTLKTSKV